jgi:hypothetical protein
LGDDIIEASEFLKSWVQQRLIFGTTVRYGSDGADVEGSCFIVKIVEI